ncbi:cholecystokinin-like [Hoplias malabaricus]|uniref:cholecystokinin-like n=1 Tax=Hoplias malabaricus TaxID=27720 RepID=UPI0034630B68
MYGSVGVCVLLVSLSVSCLARPRSSVLQEGSDVLEVFPSQMEAVLRVSRSAPEEEVEPRANISQLLARLISRKGSVRRNSTGNNHRIKDRDYLGWMDFGRRSAEEYEYSS